jgi:hypothetical protein
MLNMAVQKCIRNPLHTRDLTNSGTWLQDYVWEQVRMPVHWIVRVNVSEVRWRCVP